MLAQIVAFLTAFLAILLPAPLSRFQNPVVLPPIALETIFQADHSWTATLSGQKKVTLIATGDVLPARTINQKSVATANYAWMWQETAELIKNGDITFINLETPLVTNCPQTAVGTVFCGDTRHAAGIAEAGVDVVNIANNHIGNYKEAGIVETVALLKSVNLTPIGVPDTEAVITVGDTRIAFFGFNDIYPETPGGYWAHPETIKSQIELAKTKADLVVVQFHWGNEYTTTVSNRQKELGHLAIDSGADLVIGNHPHWVQPIEIYKGKLITYAHGNFIFDQMWSDKTRQGIVGKYVFYNQQLIDVEFVPVYMQPDGSPIIAPNAKRQEILTGLSEESYKLQNKLPTQVTSGNFKSDE